MLVRITPCFVFVFSISCVVANTIWSDFLKDGNRYRVNGTIVVVAARRLMW